MTTDEKVAKVMGLVGDLVAARNPSSTAHAFNSAFITLKSALRELAEPVKGDVVALPPVARSIDDIERDIYFARQLHAENGYLDDDGSPEIERLLAEREQLGRRHAVRLTYG